MTLRLLKPIDADGEIIPAGKVVKIYDPETAQEMIKQGIGCPIDPAGTMDEILRQTITDIDVGRMWQVTPEVREIEDAIDQIYVEVMAGIKNVEDLEAVVTLWKNAGTQRRRLN